MSNAKQEAWLHIYNDFLDYNERKKGKPSRDHRNMDDDSYDLDRVLDRKLRKYPFAYAKHKEQERRKEEEFDRVVTEEDFYELFRNWQFRPGPLDLLKATEGK